MRSIVLLLAMGVFVLHDAPMARGQSTGAADARSAWSNQPARPGDIIRLRIWQEETMSGDFTVDQDGAVVLPRLGRVQVSQEAPPQLRDRLVREYQRYLTHTSIEVTLLRRVQVLGAVRNPGLHPVDATMTVSDVLALAGGATPEGDPDRIELIRGGDRIVARLSTNTRIAESAIQSGDQIFVPERSWFTRNSGIIAAGLTSLIIALLTR